MKEEVQKIVDIMSQRFVSHPWHGIEVGDNVVTDPNNELQNGQEVLIK